MTSSYDKMKYYIATQLQDARQDVTSSYSRRLGNPFITISRQAGAYGMTFAEMLAEYLNKHEKRKKCTWTVFDKNLITLAMKEHRLPESFEQYFLEKPKPEIEDTVESIFGLHPSKETLIHKMNQTIFHLAQLGYVIFVGRGANLVTRSLNKGLHIRLMGSLDNRQKHIQEYLNLNERQALAYVMREERDREKYIRKYFGKNINDALLYDLIVNTDTVSIEEIVQLIGDLFLRGQCQDAGIERSLRPAQRI